MKLPRTRCKSPTEIFKTPRKRSKSLTKIFKSLTKIFKTLTKIFKSPTKNFKSLTKNSVSFTVNNPFYREQLVYREQKVETTVNKISRNLLIISVTVNTVINFTQLYITNPTRIPTCIMMSRINGITTVFLNFLLVIKNKDVILQRNPLISKRYGKQQ